VQEMHTALNTKIDVRLQEVSNEIENSVEIWFRSEEAYEWENYEKVDKLLTKVFNIVAV
jgi:hypothetical protein